MLENAGDNFCVPGKSLINGEEAGYCFRIWWNKISVIRTNAKIFIENSIHIVGEVSPNNNLDCVTRKQFY